MNENTLIRVKEIEVIGLFRLYNHKLELHLDDRVTIIHGPNGVGKTVILRLVAALFSGQLIEFSRVPFKQFAVNLTDGSKILIEPLDTQGKSRKTNKNQSLRISLHRPHQKPITEKLKFDPDGLHELAKRIEIETPWLTQIGPDRWHDRRAGEILSASEILSRYGHMTSAWRHRTNLPMEEPDWFTSIRNRVNIHLIETQRLLRMTSSEGIVRYGSDHAMVPTVRDYAQDLHRRINETLARYASESQVLDQSFPQRLLKEGRPPLSPKELKLRMTNIEEKRAQLKSIGLLDESAAYPFDITSLDYLNPTQNSVMTFYVQDTEKKLSVLEDLARRVELLRDNVNQKYQHKSLRVVREEGVAAVGHDGTPLEIESLSSGEQHEFVLLYDLLFRVKPNALVLIDEPELSLHVVWQKRFLTDLLEIVRTAKFDALVATHSPFIVGDRSDLMIALDAEAK